MNCSTQNTLAFLRKKKGLTQHQVAEYIGVSDKAVSKWERGLSKPDISSLSQLALLLDSDVASLIEDGSHASSWGWKGCLILRGGISPETLVADTPLLDIMLSYFALVGIREVVLVSDEADAFVRTRCHALSGRGFRVSLVDGNDLGWRSKVCALFGESDVFVISAPVFLYGLNLTRSLKKAMGRKSGVTRIAAYSNVVSESELAYDSEQRLISPINNEVVERLGQFRFIPFSFCPHGMLAPFLEGSLLDEYVEPLRRGMISMLLESEEDIKGASDVIRALSRSCDCQIYQIDGLLEADR